MRRRPHWRSAGLSPMPDAAGWNGGSVEVPFTAADGASGVQDTTLPTPLVFNSEGANQFQQVTVTDGAGNSAPFESPHVNIDRPPPVVQPVVTRRSSATMAGTRSDVQIAWSIDESRRASSRPPAARQQRDRPTPRASRSTAIGDLAGGTASRFGHHQARRHAAGAELRHALARSQHQWLEQDQRQHSVHAQRCAVGRWPRPAWPARWC